MNARRGIRSHGKCHCCFGKIVILIQNILKCNSNTEMYVNRVWTDGLLKVSAYDVHPVQAAEPGRPARLLLCTSKPRLFALQRASSKPSSLVRLSFRHCDL